MKSIFHKCVFFYAMTAPNPTQYSKFDNGKVKTQHKNWSEIMFHIQFREFPHSRTVGRYTVPYGRQVRSTAHCQTLSSIYKYLPTIDEYLQFLQERSLFRKACRNSFDEFGLWATRCNDLPPICIRTHPYLFICIRMHPYASMHLIYVPEHQYSTHPFAKKVKQSTQSSKSTFL